MNFNNLLFLVFRFLIRAIAYIVKWNLLSQATGVYTIPVPFGFICLHRPINGFYTLSRKTTKTRVKIKFICTGWKWENGFGSNSIPCYRKEGSRCCITYRNAHDLLTNIVCVKWLPVGKWHLVLLVYFHLVYLYVKKNLYIIIVGNKFNIMSH